MMTFHGKCITQSNLSSALVAQESGSSLKAIIFQKYFMKLSTLTGWNEQE